MDVKSKIYIDYDDVLSMCRDLEHGVSKFKPDVIVGIVRGGLVPALILSHQLDVGMRTIAWQTRDVSNRQDDPVLRDMIASGKRVAFVDDINDTGYTFETISQSYGCPCPNVLFASLVTKKASMFRVGAITGTVVEDDRWINFPWEKQ